MLQRKTYLARGPGPARTTRLAPVSKKHRAGQQVQREAYAAADDAGAEWCAVCGRAGAVEHSHLFSQHLHEAHRNNPLNWLQSCRACHDLFEHHKPKFAKVWPAAWAEIIRRMQLVDLQAYDFYAATLPELYPD